MTRTERAIEKIRKQLKKLSWQRERINNKIEMLHSQLLLLSRG